MLFMNTVDRILFFLRSWPFVNKCNELHSILAAK